MTVLNFFGEDARFHHIGIAVKSIKDVSPSSKIITDPIQKVHVAFVSLNGVETELIEPYGDNSPISESLMKGIKFLHICYAMPDIEKTIKECRKYRFHCIANPMPAVALNNNIAWVYSNQFGLFELLEMER